ncbi:MAG: histidine--tRNA ligase [Deltaproteobacteria bacterium]|nr:MAG: histidine--tRNA ligase [Deltaproteobacteria bacterium]
MSVFLPKGTRDFLPEQMQVRLRAIDTIRAVFESFGFEPLETPAFERIETLSGKYGEEADKLMFRIHKRGRSAKPGECDLGLRYDLTVPLARVLAMNADLRLPFKRWQIQPVWRAERPQKGRFREFWQCDVDIAGSRSPLADAECIAVADAALRALGFEDYTIRVNDRRILTELAREAGASSLQEELSFLIALDKLDKIGLEGVERELVERGFEPDKLGTLWSAIAAPPTTEALLQTLQDVLSGVGLEGVDTLRTVIAAAEAMGVDPSRVRFDPSLARGADYYTGPVFEVAGDDPSVGSVAGGGRYDGLVGRLSGRELPAVGVSLGLERLITLLEAREDAGSMGPVADLLITVFDDGSAPAASRAATAFRAAGVKTELYIGDGRLKAQLKHADRRGYAWIALIGPDEASAGTVTLKNRRTWENTTLDLQAAVNKVSADRR